ncbi:MAG: hypothetical protein GXX86_12770, partial [Propionibacterium sp.]|nr:hypothetical protein [Propionibacterium sp.]
MRKPALLAVAAILGATSLMGPAAYAEDAVEPTEPVVAADTEAAPAPAVEEAPAPEAPAEEAPAAEAPAEEAPAPEAPAEEAPAPEAPAEEAPAAEGDEAAAEPVAEEETPAVEDGATAEDDTENEVAQEQVATTITGITLEDCIVTVSIAVGDDAASVVILSAGEESAQTSISGSEPGDTLEWTVGAYGPLESPFEVRVLDADGNVLASATHAFDSDVLAAECPLPPEDDDAADDADDVDAPVVTGPSTILTDEISRDVCEVTIPVEHGDGQQKTIQVWDDMQQIDEVTVAGNGDSISTAVWTIKNDFMTGAPGVAFLLTGENGEYL